MHDLLSSPDGEDFFCTPLETAAKRRKGAGNEVPCWGLGQSPKQGMGWQPHRNPKRKAQPKMNQGAKRYLIPLTPHPLAPTSPIFQTPPAKRIIR